MYAAEQVCICAYQLCLMTVRLERREGGGDMEGVSEEGLLAWNIRVHVFDMVAGGFSVCKISVAMFSSPRYVREVRQFLL